MKWNDEPSKGNRLRPLSQFANCGIPLRTLQRWCEDGDVNAEKRGQEWYIDIVDMLRRHGHEGLANHTENQDKD